MDATLDLEVRRTVNIDHNKKSWLNTQREIVRFKTFSRTKAVCVDNTPRETVRLETFSGIWPCALMEIKKAGATRTRSLSTDKVRNHQALQLHKYIFSTAGLSSCWLV